MISYKEAQGHYNMHLVGTSKVLLKYFKFDGEQHILKYIETIVTSRKELPSDLPKEAMVALFLLKYWWDVLDHLESLGLKPKEKYKFINRFSD